MRKIGFTLAEVLITLTIIGIIAALTIPNLMQSYKKHQVEVKLKDTYAILSNALNMSENENGSTSEWKIYWSTSKIADIAENKLIPYLKVTKNCKDTKNLCIKSITDMDGNIFDISYSFILANGTSLGIVVQSEQFILLFADIDGPERGKSELGRDVFAFSIINNNYSPQVSFSPGAFYSPSKKRRSFSSARF